MLTLYDGIVDALKRRDVAEALTGDRHERRAAIEAVEREIERLEDLIPCQSGFGAGYKIDDESDPSLLIINAAFHRLTPAGHLIGRYDIEARTSRNADGALVLSISGGLESERDELGSILESALNAPYQPS